MKREYTSNMPIEGFSKYHICKNGRLYSIHSGTWRLIKPVPKNTGYISNNLISDSGKRVNFYRHRLVAEVYLPKNDDTLVVCHKDNNPRNNRVSNLYWGTPRENTQQCIRDGRFPFRKKKIIDENKLIHQYNLGIPRKAILEEFQIPIKPFYRILRKYNVKLRK
jgi:hypothetical protein